MNECFILGKIIDNVEFSFTIRKKPYSIAKFNIILENNTKITVYVFDELADFCYKKLNIENIILIYGNLRKKENIILIAKSIEIINEKMKRINKLNR